MHLTSLDLANFRNYTKQRFDFGPGAVLLLGANAQGKTNVLEAVFLLATSRSERAAADADYIAFAMRDAPQPFARIVGQAQRAAGEVTVELTIAGRPGARGLIGTKRYKLNGVAKRAADAVGAITAVLFTTDDMELIKGAPAGRRRYLDTMLTQAGRPYARALSAYNKIVTQRNALLKRIGEGAAKKSELAYWDEELSREGATLLVARAAALVELSPIAAETHARLSGGQEELTVEYAPRLDWPPERIAAAAPGDIAAALRSRLDAMQPRDIGAGQTITGPHRDDMTVLLDGEPASSFGSRGQQRTAAGAQRRAQARQRHARAGEQPVLLLDDVLSELDEARRASVLDAIEADQMIISSADADRFPRSFTKKAQVWRIEAGAATRE